ncbi:DUF6176 family protein [Candidatus Protochlamydia phocaeensis]|uniref:DUF6176 family protein n=1 Tax=Candidatus Protochlamydia phocaeensis TaxID=1414722 RepID=UPI000A679B0C|nr:DUF6176 family protein [Candidatus Protochlamydia phocaeensis]
MKRTLCIRSKLKKGALPSVREWFRTLKERIHETMATLEQEGVIIESVFLDRIGEDDFLIYYMKAENIEKALEIYKKSTSPIDLYHKENWKLFSESSIVLEELMDLERFS